MIFLKAAAYDFHIAKAQAFVDGNQIVALDAALTFLALNDYEIVHESIELYDAMIAIAERNMSSEQWADLLEKLTN